MGALVKKMKWFIIATLVVLLAGMTLFGFLGMNNTVDYRQSYEVEVSVDQGFDEANDILKSSSDKFLKDNGLNAVSYQILNEGSKIVYKFNYNVAEKIDGLAAAVDTALDVNEKTKDVTASAQVREVIGNQPLQFGKVLLAFGIGAVIIFLCLLVFCKLACSLSALCSYVLSALVFIAFVALTRVPALPHVEYGVMFAASLSAILSTISVLGYKGEMKNAKVKEAGLVAQIVTARQSKMYLFTLIAVFISAVALIALFVPYMMYAGIQLILAGISAVCVSYFLTPIVWMAIKRNGKK